MREGIISTHDVRLAHDKQSAVVLTTLDAGQVVPGMFVHIPLNGNLAVTVPISDVVSVSEHQIRIVLDCEEVTEIAEMVEALNFTDETLLVCETGER